MSHGRFTTLLTAVTLAASGCNPDGSVASPGQRVDTEFTPSSAFPGLVTNSASSSAVSGDTEVSYASLAPGIVPTGTSATIVNRRTNRSISTAMADGGFDPVAIGARAADTILVSFSLPNGPAQRTWIVVPSARRPAIVRNEPRSARRGVPLDATMLIVFSEPIDPASVSTSTIALERNGETIAGIVEVLPQQPWTARFIPAARLASDATYELVVTAQVRDLSGETLESPARVSFTTAAATQPAAGRLAFSRWNGSAVTLYTVSPDGTGLAEIGQGMDPSFSPDGYRIAFWRYDGGGGVIYTANADGSDVTRVTSGHHPTWSPDGRRLAFGCGGICLINVDGTGRTRLTPETRASESFDVCVRDTDPSWSPNGSTIAFTRWPDQRIPSPMCTTLGVVMNFPFDFWTTVWLIEADGSNLRPVRDGTGLAATHAAWPSWSPDGKRLAFYATNGSEDRIDVADADGSVVTTVVRRNPPDWANVLGSPDWSPDGKRILYGNAGGWGFADASGAGGVEVVVAPGGIVPSSLSWSWSRR